MAAESPVPITPEGRAALEAELRDLVEVRRPEVVARIAHTRDQGDLRENAGYHQAREDQSRIEGRVLEIEGALRNHVLIDPGVQDGAARLGSTVTVEDDHGEAVYRLVGPTEVDASRGRLSAESPMGRALIGARAGDVVEVDAPGGKRRLRVSAVA